MGSVARRPVVGRLQRPRLLGLRDLDVPDPAGHRAGAWPARACSTATTGSGPPGPTPGRPGGRVPASPGRARCAAPRRRRRSRRPASSRSTSTPTSRSPSTSTGWPPATGAGWPPAAGRSSQGIARYYVSRATKRADGSLQHPQRDPARRVRRGRERQRLHEHVRRPGAPLRRGRRADPAPAGRPALVAGRARPADPVRPAKGIHPEYAGYPGDAVKQADVTLLSYPWEHRQPRRVTRADLDYYVPRTDPGGPSMTDAIHSIVTSELGTPGARRSPSPDAARTRSCDRRTTSSPRRAAAAPSPSPPAPAGSCRSSSTATPGSAGARTACGSTRACRPS